MNQAEQRPEQGFDLTNALQRDTRLTVRVQQLGKRPSEDLDRSSWAESGLGAPAGVGWLQRCITRLEQQLAAGKAS
ncbi:hypothetical protein [Streptomyces mirabilis]|uniref:hypothetical protein n=1 Tax=Streptomyces mirabilis TaxID=68239 RepID=UPI000765B9DE|nr:hypothetical protein [Streptomyces mirabilis]MCX4429472.1 hypothetical protein [Streptomyces mirabilis]